MNCVIFVDPHLRDKTNSYPLTLDEIYLNPLLEIRDYVLRNKIQFLYCLGDIFENRVSLNSRIQFLKFLKTFLPTCRVNILMGNHDRREHGYYTFSELEEFKIKNLKIVSTPCFQKNEHIVEIPYCRQQKVFENYLIKFGMLSFKYLLLVHQQFKGAKYNQKFVEKEFDLKIPSNAVKVFSGHIHKPQILKEKRIFFTGSTQRMNFGEEGEQKYFIHYKDGKVSYIPIKSLRNLKTVFSFEKALKLKNAEVRLLTKTQLSEKKRSLLQKMLAKNGSALVSSHTLQKNVFEVKGVFSTPREVSKIKLLQQYLDSFDFSDEVKKEILKRSDELFSTYETSRDST